jgi:hypothetical protein
VDTPLGTFGTATTLLGQHITGTQGLTGSIPFPTTGITYTAIDITINSLTAGTTPSITIYLERFAADGNWYNIWNTGTVTTLPATYSIDTAPSATTATTGNPVAPTEIINAVYTQQARIRWTTTGAPTAADFTVSVVGR